MVAELGLLALLLSLGMALLLSVLPMVGSYSAQARLMATAKPLSFGLFGFTLLAFVILTLCFVANDFSVLYVARHSNVLLPLQYKISAVWGGHEGSLLLWVLILTGWVAALALRSDHLPRVLSARVQAVLGMVTTGFLLFVLFTSNPFLRSLPFPPSEGADLNPLLQDVGMIFHPPLLYMGYVGFAVAFAFAIGALLEGELSTALARWIRPWATVAWILLTLGIALGSWWAYYELGWGGWWFWDPVENASLMPWLVGTALMHSLAVSEKRGLFKSWTLLLAIATFSLSLLGTFLVRSGVLTSVHAFASDPERGVFILVYLLVVIGGSLVLFALRAPELKSTVRFDWLSRETFLLVNNVLLIISAATVLLGTLFPLLMESLGAGMVSVGPPYFNAVFAPMALLLFAALGVGVTLNWKSGSLSWLLKQLRPALLLSVVSATGFSLYLAQRVDVMEWLAAALVCWIVLTAGIDIHHKTRHTDLLSGLKRLKPSYYGMHLAHIGLAVTVVGVVMVNGFSSHKDVRMKPGQMVELGGYQFLFEGVRPQRGPNFVSDVGSVRVLKDQHDVVRLYPEKRIYTVQNMPMTEAGLDWGITRDLYVVLGEPLGNDGSWSVRINIKSFVRWIWFGALLMALGGLLAVSDRRYRRVQQPQATGVTV